MRRKHTNPPKFTFLGQQSWKEPAWGEANKAPCPSCHPESPSTRKKNLSGFWAFFPSDGKGPFEIQKLPFPSMVWLIWTQYRESTGKLIGKRDVQRHLCIQIYGKFHKSGQQFMEFRMQNRLILTYYFILRNYHFPVPPAEFCRWLMLLLVHKPNL